MANFPFTVGDSLRIGSATISASGNAVVLPTGTQVGNQNVATTVEVSTGGGPKITNLQVTSNVYVILDDTAVDLTGGFIKITGTNFVSGCMVYVASTPANSTTFVGTTEVRAQLPATAAGTYPVYLVNPDGGTAIRVPGVTFSASPAWQTGSSLGEQYDGVVLTLPVVATDATVYTLSSGSLPPGLSLNSNTGVISGTVSGVANDTVYSFTITATDAQLQDSPRTFTVTITISDPYFRLTTLLLSGSALSANTVVRDSSTNNFNLTVVGDSRASNFTPYGTGWSVQFDGTGDYLSIPTNAALNLSSGDFTIEGWAYWTGSNSGGTILNKDGVSGTSFPSYLLSLNGSGYFRSVVGSGNGTGYIQTITSSVLAPINQWVHLAFVKNGTTLTLYQNGTNVGSATQTGTIVDGAKAVLIGYETGQGSTTYWSGYISNTRIVKGTALYTANFTPATTNLTAVANTSLLTCHVNGFRDASTNNFTITTNGDTRVVSFNPFNITNTSVNGSAYFDGTGDYLSTPANTAFAMGTGDFTVEFWYYPVTYGSSQNIISHQYTTGFAIGTQTSGTEFYIAGSFISTATRPTLGMWNHVVCQRASGTASIYFNGTRVQTGSLTGSATSTTALVIGAAVHNLPNEASNGYLSDIRIVKGSAVYSGVTITPPAAPLSAIANTSLLTCQYDQPHNNHTFLDSSSNQFLITRSGNATQGTFSPFSQSGWGNYFNGSTGYLTTPQAIVPASYPFTVEANFYVTPGVAVQSLFIASQTTSSGYGFGLGFIPDGRLAVAIDTAGGAQNILATVSVSSGRWYHVAFSIESDGTGRLFLDGEEIGSNTFTNAVNQTITLDIGRRKSAPDRYWNGNISNFRITQSALYTVNFSPPTSPLTSSVDTLLLTCQSNRFVDNSGTPKTITPSGTVSVQAFSPFAPTAVYNPVVHGGSAYFDGSSDYLSVTNNGLFGAGDWTIEFWMYAPIGQTDKPILETRNPASGDGTSTGFTITMITSTEIRVFSGSELLRVTVQYVNTWLHIALSKKSGTSRLYFNGTQVATTTSLGTMSDTSFIIGAGYYGVTSLNAFGQFYMSSLRVLTGTGYDTSTITVPTAPPTAITNTSLLLNFTDAAILDSSGRQVLETLADAKSSSAITKFTGGSMSFDGTGDYLQSSAPLSELAFLHNGTPWTVEGWFYTGSTSAQTILSTDAASASIGMTIALNDTTTRDIYAIILRGVSGSWVLAISPTNSWNLNTWTHFAVTFDSSKNLTVYINGVQVATASGSSFAFSTANPSYPLVVGRYQSPTPAGYFNGYISDLRVTRGYARYTGNFTAPTVSARLK
jgi:hypothetical protein